GGGGRAPAEPFAPRQGRGPRQPGAGGAENAGFLPGRGGVFEDGGCGGEREREGEGRKEDGATKKEKGNEAVGGGREGGVVGRGDRRSTFRTGQRPSGPLAFAAGRGRSQRHARVP